MAKLKRTYLEDLDPMPEFQSAQEPVRLDDTILMEDESPTMNIDFDLRVDLDERSKRVLKEDLSNLLGHYRHFEDNPKKVIISRPTSDPYDTRIIAMIKSESGGYLGSIIGEANGTGMLTFSPSGR